MKHSDNKYTGYCNDCALSGRECTNLLRLSKTKPIAVITGDPGRRSGSLFVCTLWRPKERKEK